MRCRKCNSKALATERLPVVEGTGFTNLTQCLICGDIYREVIDTAKPLRFIDMADLRNRQVRRGCLVAGCSEAHFAVGYCQHHYWTESYKHAAANL